MTFLFVGERQSPLAYRKGWTWRDGRVCAGTLHAALRAAGVDPAECDFTNAYEYDGSPRQAVLDEASAAVRRGVVVVALGQLAHRALGTVPHLVLVHPAARGAIRRRDTYQQHVHDVLARVAA